MNKKNFYYLPFLIIASIQMTSALELKETARYFNGPTISQIETTSATVSLSPGVLSGVSDDEKKELYFEYYETDKVCIAIYPTPDSCLPKKTVKGEQSVKLSNLSPKTSYTVVYKKDNTIRCITTPCPENSFQSLAVTFMTKAVVGTTEDVMVTINLRYRNYGDQVIALQNILIKQGYLTSQATGYFGVLTLKAVKDFQRANEITPTGFVGPLTRAALERVVGNPSFPVVKKFEGTVTGYSTGCYSDEVCSISVDGKKVVTTIGWSQEILGKVLGLPDFGSIENNIGAHAKVYAKKVEDGYTLYGDTGYYIEVIPKNGVVPTATLLK